MQTDQFLDVGPATIKGRYLKRKAERENLLNLVKKISPHANDVILRHYFIQAQVNSSGLRKELGKKYTGTSIDKIVDSKAAGIEALANSEVVQDIIFDSAIQNVIKPKLDILIKKGFLTEADAQFYVYLISDEYQELKRPSAEQALSAARKAQLAQKSTNPALKGVHAIVTAVWDKKYKDIFQCLSREEDLRMFSQAQQAMEEIILPERAGNRTIFDVVKYSPNYHNNPFEQNYSKGYGIKSETIACWEALRTSSLSKLFSEDVWNTVAEKIIENNQSNITYYNSGRNAELFDSHWSMIKESPALRQKYIPIMINILFKGINYWDTSARIATQTAFYTLISSLTAEDLTILREQGFTGVATIKTLVETNPETFATEWLPNPDDPDNRRTRLPAPVYQDLCQQIATFSLEMLAHEGLSEREVETAVDNLKEAWNQIYSWYGDRGRDWKDPAEIMDFVKSGWMMIKLRDRDRILKRVGTTKKLPRAKSKEEFSHAINALKEILVDPEIPGDKKTFLASEPVMTLLARQPEKSGQIMNIILRSEGFNKLVALMTPDGPLGMGIDGTLHEVFSGGNTEAVIDEILEGFSGTKPYWQMLFDTCRRIYGEDIRNMDSKYPITEVPTKDGILGVAELVLRHNQQKQASISPTILEELIADEEIIKQLEKGSDSIPLASFHGMIKERIFGEYLKQAVQLSRNPEAKQRADSRNRRFAQRPLIAKNLYVHATAIDVLDPVLMNGNLSKQVLGTSDLTVKNWQFHTDFIKFDQGEEANQSLGRVILAHERIGIYGATDPRTMGTLGTAGQIFFIYDRNDTQSYEVGKDYEPLIKDAQRSDWENHRIIPGGMPSTEISAIMLSEPRATFEKALHSIADNGFYIPIYDLDGNLLLTPEQFDSYKQFHNLNVPVPVWESSFKVGDAKGSHQPAGEYQLPSLDGEQKRFYVKFAKFNFPGDPQSVQKEQEEQDRIWNEFLTAKIYRQLRVLVPETEVVRVNRTYGHALSEKIADARAYAHISQMLTVDPKAQDVIAAGLKNGFIADVLLANWDVIKSGNANLAVSNGEVYRIDTGGGLIFRATGKRKTGDEFSGAAIELASMRYAYPGLIDSDIRQQIMILQEKFQDQDIDRLVDSVRLNNTDRDYLKKTLRQRRNYILDFYQSGSNIPMERNLSDQARTIESILKAENLDDLVIAEAIPGWEGLTGPEGYQHNGVLLGDHIRSTIATVKYLPEYWSLSENERNLALIAALFHDFGKPTGRKNSAVERDFDHEIPSAQMAASYMNRSGYSISDIQTVVQVILNDGIVSDIARGKVRDPRKNLTPLQLKEILNSYHSVIKILRAVNRADVIATVGIEGFESIENNYNQFFDETLKQP